MANKYRKIKRHKIHYKRNRKGKSVLKTVLFILLILALIFLAYSVAGPVKKLLSGELSDNTSSAAGSSQIVSSSAPDTTSSQTSSETKPEENKTISLVMPTDVILDVSKWDAFLSKAKTDGYTAVVAELKDDEGKIYFQSSVTSINGNKAVVQNAVSAEQLAQKIKEAGFTPIASIHTFKDRTAPDKTKNNTFMVKNSTYTWFDDSASEGGKPWLDPYREAARTYNLMVVEDLAKAGFTDIILNSVQLPELNSMGKSDLDTSTPISEILSQFIAEAQSAAQKYQAKVSVSYPSTAYWTAKPITYGGEAGGIKAGRISPVIRLSDYGKKLTFGETVIENPAADPAGAVKAVIDQIKAKTAAQNPEIIPIIPSGQDTQAVIQALQKAGIDRYIVE